MSENRNDFLPPSGPEIAGQLSPETTLEYFGHVSHAFMVRMTEAMQQGTLIPKDELQAWKTVMGVADPAALEALGVSPAPLIGTIDAQITRFHTTIPTN